MTNFVFFGTSHFSVFLLTSLKEKGILPSLIVSTPDKPKGRKLLLTPTPVKTWAIENNIPVITPESLKVEIPEIKNFDLFIVASYGKILPNSILFIPKFGTLNVHPSLLPRYRGASPLQSAILADEKRTGVSIMQLDEEMDHGPILAQEEIHITEWPTLLELKKITATIGASLLSEILPHIPEGKILAKEQDHAQATYTKKITKEDGLINFADDPYLNFRKVQAYTPWPSTYYFLNGKRIKITKARFDNGTLVIEKIVPEGKSEIDFTPQYNP